MEQKIPRFFYLVRTHCVSLASGISTAIIKRFKEKVLKVRRERAKVLLLYTNHRPDCAQHPRCRLLLPSCKASFMMEAPRGSSWLQADLKKDSAGRETSSPAPGLKLSHMPLKSCTFSSSRDMIAASFRLNWSAQQSKGTREEIYIFIFLSTSILAALTPRDSLQRSFPPLISFVLVSSCLLSSSVSLGIPSSSSLLSLSNQAKGRTTGLSGRVKHRPNLQLTLQMRKSTQQNVVSMSTSTQGCTVWLAS